MAKVFRKLIKNLYLDDHSPEFKLDTPNILDIPGILGFHSRRPSIVSKAQSKKKEQEELKAEIEKVIINIYTTLQTEYPELLEELKKNEKKLNLVIHYEKLEGAWKDLMDIYADTMETFREAHEEEKRNLMISG